MSNATNSPIDRIRVGRITAAIWKNETDDGKHFYSFTVSRTYKDASGNYQSTDSFGLSDALVLAKVANLADSRIRKLLDADRAESNVAESYEEDVAA